MSDPEIKPMGSILNLHELAVPGAFFRLVILGLAVWHTRQPTQGSGDVLGVADAFIRWLDKP